MSELSIAHFFHFFYILLVVFNNFNGTGIGTIRHNRNGKISYDFQPYSVEKGKSPEFGPILLLLFRIINHNLTDDDDDTTKS